MDEADYVPQSPNLTGLQSPNLAGQSFDDEPQLDPQHQRYRGSISHSVPYTPTHQTAQYFPDLSSISRRSTMDIDEDYLPPVARSTGKRASRKSRIEGNGSIERNVAATPPKPVEVKTKFPVARIKRIMQADEDVGKVAQVTPVVVSKALELFMISLVTKAASEAKVRGSKRVSAAHLKQAVTKDQQFDFLAEIVKAVPDAPAPSDKHDDDEPSEGKKRKGGGRKKRKDNDDF